MLFFHHSILRKATGLLSSVTLLGSFSASIMGAVFSVYLNSFIGNVSVVGGISSAITLVSMVLFLFSTRIVEKNDERKLWIFSAFLLMVSYFVFAFANVLWLVLLFTLVWATGRVLYMESTSVLIRDAVDKKHIGEQEAVTGVLKNVGWMIGPLVAGFMLAELGVHAPFLLAGAFMFLAVLYFRSLKLRRSSHADSKGVSPLLHAKHYFQDKNRTLAYVLNGGLSLYWAVTFTYLPLYLLSLGLAPWWIGVYLFAIALPLVLFGKLSGKLCDKGLYRSLFSVSYAGIAFCVALAFAFSHPLLVLLFLTLASVFAAFLESTREAYYFSVVKKREEEWYLGTYMTSWDLASTFGKVIIAGMLVFLPLQFFFLATAIFMSFFAVVGLSVKRIH